MDVGDASATLALSELPRDLRAALTTLDARAADDLEPVHAAKHELQSLLDAETHDARCDAFSAIVRREKSRLLARKAFEEAVWRARGRRRHGAFTGGVERRLRVRR